MPVLTSVDMVLFCLPNSSIGLLSPHHYGNGPVFPPLPSHNINLGKEETFVECQGQIRGETDLVPVLSWSLAELDTNHK